MSIDIAYIFAQIYLFTMYIYIDILLCYNADSGKGDAISAAPAEKGAHHAGIESKSKSGKQVHEKQL